MSKMLFAMITLGSTLAAASDTKCAVDGGKAVDQATDAAIYLWAATKRCGSSDFAEVKCAMDITATTTAVANMANIIVAALDECDVIKTADKGCGETAGQLVAAVSGLASMAAGMVDGCQKGGDDTLKKVNLERDLTLGKCLVDAKKSLASIFGTVSAFKKIAAGKTSTHNDLNVVSAFAALGSAIAGAVDHCSAFTDGSRNGDAHCASVSLGAVNELHSIANIATSMANTCEAGASRLYLENAKNTGAATSNSMGLALAAFLPFAAVLGFVAGRRFGKSSSNRDTSFAQVQAELESLQ